MKKWLITGGVVGIISAAIVLIKREKQYREWKMTVFGATK